MKFNIYKSISKYAKEKLNEGATIVDFLTDWKTPCYVYQLKKENIRGRDMDFSEVIAVNNGIDTYAETSNATHIFENRWENNFMIPYLLGEKIIFLGDLHVAMHMEKQLCKPYFSTFSVDENVKNLIDEFQVYGYNIISSRDRKFFETIQKNRKEVESLKEKARIFYSGK